MKIFRRADSRIELPDADEPQEVDQPETRLGRELSPAELFITVNQERLIQSAELWRTAAETVDFGSDDNYVSRIYTAMQKFDDPLYTQHKTEKEIRYFTQKKPTPEDARRLAADLGIYALIAIRYHARANKSMAKAVAKSTGLMSVISNPFVSNVVRESFDVSHMADKSVKLYTIFNKADMLSSVVLDDLTAQIDENSDLLNQLKRFIRTANGDLPPEMNELRRIIGQDWWRPDEENSILRTYIDGIRSNPEAHLEDFIEVVASENDRGRYGKIKDMARFALRANGIKAPADIRPVLKKTFPVWHEFEQIDTAFEDFKQGRNNEITNALLSLAIPKGDSHLKVRSHRTLAEIKDMKIVLAEWMLARPEKRKRSKLDLTDLPSRADLLVEKETLESEKPEEKPFYSVRHLANGTYELAKLEADDIIKEFSLEGYPENTKKDILLMVESVRKQPLGLGTKKIERSRGIRVGNELIKLRRFSPLDRTLPGRSSKDSLSFRVCYGITHGGVAIVEILQHNEFDQKY